MVTAPTVARGLPASFVLGVRNREPIPRQHRPTLPCSPSEGWGRGTTRCAAERGESARTADEAAQVSRPGIMLPGPPRWHQLPPPAPTPSGSSRPVSSRPPPNLSGLGQDHGHRRYILPTSTLYLSRAIVTPVQQVDGALRGYQGIAPARMASVGKSAYPARCCGQRIRKKPISCVVMPLPVARSARISPTTEQNL